MTRWILFAVAGLAVIAAAVVIAGFLLPTSHRAARTAQYAAAPSDVFASITDFARFAEWRTDLTSVEILEAVDNKPRFREHGAHGPVTYVVTAREPDTRLVTRIDDPSLPYGGQWTFELVPTSSGTALTITEEGEIYNPVFRALAKLFFSPTATIEQYQADLRARLERQPSR
jgi:uncharacterized protein YndB with AHSA1/START domain